MQTQLLCIVERKDPVVLLMCQKPYRFSALTLEMTQGVESLAKTHINLGTKIIKPITAAVNAKISTAPAAMSLARFVAW